MKNKIKFSLGSVITLIITFYSYNHPEKYHVLIPVIFGALFILSISFLLDELINSYKE